MKKKHKPEPKKSGKKRKEGMSDVSEKRINDYGKKKK